MEVLGIWAQNPAPSPQKLKTNVFPFVIMREEGLLFPLKKEAQG